MLMNVGGCMPGGVSVIERRKKIVWRRLAAALPFLVVMPGPLWAQLPPTRAEATAALAPASPHYSRQQLDQMLAPIALYPDQLLTQLLMATTFPQQIVDANQWLQDQGNAALKGDDLIAALQPLPWDPSVKSLVAFPQIITMLIDHWDWTQALGAAFANQQVEAMARIQFLRKRAVAAGRLRSTRELRVQREGPEVIIEPADPSVIYVPAYNPALTYGQWPDPDYPPVYVPPAPAYYGGSVERAIGSGIAFGVGYGVVRSLWGWSRPDWQRHQVVVDQPRYSDITKTTSTAVTIQNNTWHRAAPVAQVAAPVRPQPASPAAAHPPGTVTPAAVHPPTPPPTPPAQQPAAAHPPTPTPTPSAQQPAAVHPPTPTPTPPAQQPAAVHPPTPTPTPPAQQPAAVHPPTPTPAPPAQHPAAVHPPTPTPAPPAQHPAAVHPPTPTPAPPGQQPAAVHPPTPTPAPPGQQPAAVHPPTPTPAPPVQHPAAVHPPTPTPAPPVQQPAAVHPPTPTPAPPAQQPAAIHPPPAPPPGSPMQKPAATSPGKPPPHPDEKDKAKEQH